MNPRDVAYIVWEIDRSRNVGRLMDEIMTPKKMWAVTRRANVTVEEG